MASALAAAAATVALTGMLPLDAVPEGLRQG
jgi:hypothetical protein